MFKAIPDGGDVVISSNGVGVMGSASIIGNTNGIIPVTLKKATLYINKQWSGNERLTLVLFDLRGNVIEQRRIEAGVSSIVLSRNRPGSSALIAKISCVDKTWTGLLVP